MSIEKINAQVIKTRKIMFTITKYVAVAFVIVCVALFITVYINL